MRPTPDRRTVLERSPCTPASIARAACLVIALGSTSCHRVGLAPAAPPAALAACDVPTLDTRGWRLMQDSAGVTYHIPQHFVERAAEDLAYRQFETAREPAGRILVGFSPSQEYYTTLRRTPSPGMHEMSECVEDVNGRLILLQAWRMEGGLFRDGRRQDLYETLALIPVQPTLTLFVSGGGTAPGFQEVLLAIARTVDAGSP